MKNIIFVTVSMRGGGTERVISIVANRLTEMGYNVSIVMIADPTVEYELNEKIRLVCVSKATGGSLVGRIKRIYNMRREFVADRNCHIISMGTVANMFTLAAAIGLHNTIVISERNDPNRLNHRPIKFYEVWLRNILYKKAFKLVLQTPDAMECFPACIKKKSVVIPNPVPANLPEPLSMERRDKTIITAGRLTEQKNHRLLIDAFAEFSVKFPEYQLKIFGRGELEEELKSQINRLEMDNRILLCGFSKNLYEELGKAGMYISTSDWEGISNSLLEALAMGVPTIATDCPMGGARMCIEDGVNGYLVPVRNKEMLLQKMIVLAENAELRNSISQKAMDIRSEFSESLITKKWVE